MSGKPARGLQVSSRVTRRVPASLGLQSFRQFPLKEVAILVLVAGSSTAVTFFSWSSDLFLSDTAQYLSVARNILEGNGLATSIVYYDEHYRIGGLPVPQTVFPPGYPLAIAALASTGLAPHVSAFLLCLACLNLCTLLLALVLRLSGQSGESSLLGGLLFAGSVAASKNVVVCLSDVPFVAATMFCLLFVQGLKAGGMRNALFAGAACAAAFSIRYAGIFVVIALGVVLGGRLLVSRTRRALLEFVAALALPALTVCALFARNYLLVGDFKGGNAHEVARPALEVARVFVWALEDIVGYSKSGLVALHWRETILALTAVGAVLAALLARPAIAARKLRVLAGEPAHLFALAYVSISLVLLWNLEQTRHLGISSRILLPLLPFGVLLAADFLGAISWQRPRFKRRYLFMALGGLHLLGQSALLPVRHDPKTVALARSLRDSVGRSAALQQYLGEDKADGRPVLTSEYRHVPAFLEQPVLGFTSAEFTAKRWTMDLAESTLRRYGVRHILFTPRAFAEADPAEKANMEFFSAMVREEFPSWLTRVYRDEDLWVFRADL